MNKKIVVDWIPAFAGMTLMVKNNERIAMNYLIEIDNEVFFEGKVNTEAFEENLSRIVASENATLERVSPSSGRPQYHYLVTNTEPGLGPKLHITGVKSVYSFATEPMT